MLVQLLTLYTDTERHNAHRYKRTGTVMMHCYTIS